MSKTINNTSTTTTTTTTTTSTTPILISTSTTSLQHLDDNLLKSHIFSLFSLSDLYHFSLVSKRFAKIISSILQNVAKRLSDAAQFDLKTIFGIGIHTFLRLTFVSLQLVDAFQSSSTDLTLPTTPDIFNNHLQYSREANHNRWTEHEYDEAVASYFEQVFLCKNQKLNTSSESVADEFDDEFMMTEWHKRSLFCSSLSPFGFINKIIVERKQKEFTHAEPHNHEKVFQYGKDCESFCRSFYLPVYTIEKIPNNNNHINNNNNAIVGNQSNVYTTNNQVGFTWGQLMLAFMNVKCRKFDHVAEQFASLEVSLDCKNRTLHLFVEFGSTMVPISSLCFFSSVNGVEAPLFS